MRFSDKLREQLAIADADPVHASAQASALLKQFAAWPVGTQIPLTRVAELVAGITCRVPANVRAVVATDALRLVDAA